MTKRVICARTVLAALMLLTSLLPFTRVYGQPPLGDRNAAQEAAAIDPGDWVQANPSAAADSTGNTYAVWEDEREGVAHIRFAQRSPGGEWQPSLKLDAAAAGDQKAPLIASDGSGNLYAVWQDYRGVMPLIYFAYRPAGGSWQASEVISATTQTQDRPSLAVNRRGEAVIAWRQGAYPTYDIFCITRSVDAVWRAAEKITGSGGNLGTTDVALDDWGRVYLVWEDWDTGEILFTERPPDGDWASEVSIRDSTTGFPWGMQIAVDGAGNVHAVWEDGRSGGSEIYAAYRPAMGSSWSVNVRLDAGEGDMWSPGLGIDGAGNVVAAWSQANVDVYGAVHYLGSGWTPSKLLAAAPRRLHPYTEPRGISPLASQATASYAPAFSLAGAAGLGPALLSVGASALGEYNILSQDLNSPGSGGCEGSASCRAGNGGQAPSTNVDEGFIGPPGPPPAHMSGYSVEPVDVDGQTVYVVRTGSGQSGVYSDLGDAERFGQEHAGPSLPGLSFDENAVPPADQTDETLPDVPEGPVTGGAGAWQSPLGWADMLFPDPPGVPEASGSWWSSLLASDDAPSDASGGANEGGDSWWSSVFGPDHPAPDTPDTPEETGSWWNAWNVPDVDASSTAPDAQGDVSNDTSAGDSEDSGWTIRNLETGEAFRPANFDRMSLVSVYRGKLNVLPKAEKQSSNAAEKATDPVLLHSGEFVHAQTLLHIPGRGLDYALHLSYHSQLLYDGSFGWGWTHNYDRRVVPVGGGSLALRDGAGRFDVYTFDGITFTPPAGRYTSLLSTTAGITITDRYGGYEIYHPLDASPVAGRLRALTDRYGNALTLAYDAQGRLQTVTDTLGREVIYSYDASDHISAVTDYTGRTVTFAYDTHANLVSVTTPVVTGTLNGNDFPQGKTTIFSYTIGFDDQRLNHNLVSIVAPNEVADGSLTPRTLNTYATEGFAFDRVVTQSWGGGRANASGVPAGGDVTLFYTTALASDAPVGAASKTTVTDRDGNVIEFWHDGAGHRLRKRQTVAGQVLVTDVAYNLHGEVTRIIYPAGNYIAYTYDTGAADRLAQGNLLEVRRVADAGRGCDGVGIVPCADLVTSYTYTSTFQQLRSITDPRGHTVTHTRDAVGNLVKVTFPDVTGGLTAPQSASEQWTYNAWGQPLTFTDPEGNVTCYDYYTAGPAKGYRQRVTHACGGADLTTTYGYDAVGHVTVITDARGVRTEYVFNALGQVVGRTDAAETALDYEIRYWYDANDNLVRRDVENVAPDMDSDVHPMGTHSRDPVNPWLSTAYTYDLLDNVLQVSRELTVSAYITHEYRYDPLERLTLFTDPEGHRTEYTYDARLLREVTRGAGTPEAVTTAYAYDANGYLLRVINGMGDPTDFVHDGFDRRVGRVDALGNVTHWHYDANNNVVARVFRDGQEGRNPTRAVTATAPLTLSHTLYHFDARDRRYLQMAAYFIADLDVGTILLPGADGNGDGWVETNLVYDRNGNVVNVVDDNSNVTTFAYDALDQLALTADALGNTVAYTYDGNGNVIQAVATERQPDALAPLERFTTTYAFDGLNRLIETTDNLGQTLRYAYDSRSNLVFTSDANGPLAEGRNGHGNTVCFAYDGLSRLVSETHHMRAGGVGEGAVIGEVMTTYVRDDSGNTLRRTDPNGNSTAYAYDALNRGVVITYADGTLETMAYDHAHNLIQRIDANGSVMTHTYDKLGRRVRTEVDRAAGVQGSTRHAFVWDGLNRLVSASDNNDPDDPVDDSILAFRYDSLSNLRSQTQDGDTTVEAAFDGVGNRLSLRYPGGAELFYTYDALNRMIAVADGSGELVRYSYMGPRRPFSRTHSNGTYVTYVYDGNRRLTALTYRLSGDDTLLSSFSYAYDRAGNRTSETVQPGGENVTYTYDSLYRLMGAQSSDSNVTYSYDAGGNRVQMVRDGVVISYTTNEVDEYLAVGGETRTHDANGNLLTRHFIVTCAALEGITVEGPTRGYTHTPYVFTAAITPTEANTPVTYLWRVSAPGSQQVFTHTGGISDTLVFTWSLTGSHMFTVTAINACGGSVSVTHPMTISARTQSERYVYLPLILRGAGGGVVHMTASPPVKASALAVMSSSALGAADVITETWIGYEYDFGDRLVGVTTVATVTQGDNTELTSVTLRYAYDALGHRVLSQSKEGSVRYLYAGDRVLEERDENDVLSITYVGDWAVDRGERLFYQVDGLGSIRALVNAAGGVVARVDYDPFGAPLFSAGDAGSGVHMPYLFHGRRYDADVKLYIYGGQRYDPETGRYLQRDAGALSNPYIFADNNPLRVARR